MGSLPGGGGGGALTDATPDLTAVTGGSGAQGLIVITYASKQLISS